jgi:transcriptional regulator with XRE-family HTH domain
MSELDTRFELRSRMLGVLMRDARQARGQTVEACAEALACEPDQLARFETGEASPSLPELELLAGFLDVPLGRFWSDHVLAAQHTAHRPALPPAEVLALRDRLIGAQLRHARQEQGRSTADLAAELGRDPADLDAYELGEVPIPLPELEALASRLRLSMEELFAAQGTLGQWRARHRALERVRELPPDLLDFLGHPHSESYLRLAQHLAELPAGRLRQIAEGLLEITL